MIIEELVYQEVSLPVPLQSPQDLSRQTEPLRMSQDKITPVPLQVLHFIKYFGIFV